MSEKVLICQSDKQYLTCLFFSTIKALPDSLGSRKSPDRGSKKYLYEKEKNILVRLIKCFAKCRVMSNTGERVDELISISKIGNTG